MDFRSVNVDDPTKDPFKAKTSIRTFEHSNSGRSLSVHGSIEGTGRDSSRVKELAKILAEVLERYYKNIDAPKA